MKIINPLRLSRVVMVITLLIFCGLAFISYIRLKNLIEYSRLVEETNEVKLKTEKCLSYIKDAETGARGFLLTKDSTFLQPLLEANTNIFQGLAELGVLSQQNSESVMFINVFRSAALRKISFMNRFVRDYRTVPYYSIGREVLLQDKLLMDDARRYAQAVEKNLDKKLARRNQTKNSYVVATPFIIMLLSCASILLVLIAYIIIIRELRKRILIQKELEINIEALQSSNIELEQFAYIASHDLQEPLRKIRTFGNRILEKHFHTINPDAQFMIDRMQNSAERMQLLINDLLAYSSLVDHEEIEPAPVDLNVCVRNALDTLSEEIRNKGAQIQIRPLPTILGKAIQLEQLFQNLLSNALKFTVKGRVPIITIDHEIIHEKDLAIRHATKNRNFHKITVKDNGVGFNEMYKDKLFVIFQRLHGKSEYEGTGIGLAICKKVVTNHHGYIQAVSTPNEGAEFIIYLPAED
jgi:signal transduction histidine kinase